MQRVRPFLMSACLLVGWGPAWAQDYSRTYEAPYVSTPVVIDGQLDEAAWSAVPWTEEYVRYGTLGGSTGTSTRAKLAWDDTYLYLAVEAEDRDIWSTYTERDADLWNEDVVELFIDPEGDADGYMEFEMSPRNTVLDLWVEKPLFSQGGPSHFDWDAAGLQTAVHIVGTLGDDDRDSAARQDTDERWYMELALPWADTQIVSGSMATPPEPGDTWRINVTRYDYVQDQTELSQWSPSNVNGAWHEPGEYGYVTFVRAPTAVRAGSWGAVKAGGR